MKKTLLFALALSTFIACGKKATPDATANDISALIEDTTSMSATVDMGIGGIEPEFRSKIVDAEGNPILWGNDLGQTIFFRADGTGGGQSDGGEESMYESTWAIENGTLYVTKNGTQQSVHVSFEGNNLVLDGKKMEVIPQ